MNDATSNPDLKDCRAKLDRAKELLEPLRAEDDAFKERLRKETRTRVQYENDPDGSLWSVTRIAELPDTPQHFALVVSDAMSNMRSALNYLVCALVRANGGTPSKSNQFPIYEKKPTSQRDRRSYTAAVKGLRDEHKRWIKRLQPYNDRGIGSVLWVVGFFNNIDKHQELARVIVTATRGNAPAMVGKKGMHGSYAVINRQGLERGGILMKIREPDPLHPVQVAVPVEIRLSIGIPGLSLGMVEMIRDNVVGIVESFGPALDRVPTAHPAVPELADLRDSGSEEALGSSTSKG